MACGSEATTGAGVPEEFETLLEDAAVMVDEESIAGLFEADAVLVIAGSVTTRGHRSIGRVLADRSSQGGRYYADPRTVLQVSDVALALSPQAINVMRRSDNGGWRFVICCLDA